MSVSILVLEENKMAANKVASVVKTMSVPSKILMTDSMSNALEIMTTNAIDVFIFDIDLTAEKGVLFLHELRKLYPLSPVIIVSGFDDFEYKVAAFNKFKIFAYVDKPYEFRSLVAEIEKALDVAKLVNNRMIKFKRQNYVKTYFTKDIYCIQRLPQGKKRMKVTAYDETIEYTSSEEFPIRSGLDEVLNKFEHSQDIVRCHQSWLVNPKYIRGYDVNEEELILVNNIKVPLGQTYRQNVEAFI